MSHAETLIPLSPRDYLILFSLVEEDLHGYGLVKDIEARSRGRVRIDPANLYRSIRRMVQSGLVEEADGASDDPGAERRRYYRITPLGREVVALEAERLAELTAAARALDLIPDGSSTT